MLALTAAPSARAGATVDQKCRAGKLKLVAKKASCELDLAARGGTDFSKCTTAFSTGFGKLTTTCPGDQTSLEGQVEAFRAQITAALTPVSNQCEAGKIKATARKQACELGVEKKSILRGTTADLTACQTRFRTAFMELEGASAGCAITGDAGTIEDDVDAFVAGVFDAVTGSAPTTTSTTTTTLPVILMVVRGGDGSTSLDPSSVPVFVEERLLSGAFILTEGNPIALPTTASAPNRALTLSGQSDTEGSLARSSDGHYLTMAGYDAPPGTANVQSTATSTVNRVVARIDAGGNVDTSTVLTTAFSGNNVRSVVTVDGTRVWVGGASDGSTGGIFTLPFGGAGGTQILTHPDNVKRIAIVGGQLYGDTGASGTGTVFTVGSGLPITTGQSATTLPGAAVNGGSPYDFVLLDRNASVPGPDTMYVADDRTPPDGGVQKWTFDGTTWTLVHTFGADPAAGVRGLTGFVTGPNVTLVATTATEGDQNHLVVIVDDGSPSPTATIVATAAPNTRFRGVALKPE